MRYKKLTFIVCMLLMIAGCANSPMPTQNNKNVSVQQLDGTPLPSGAIIDNKNSIIFGEGASWTGRVDITTNLKVEDTVKFFIREYPTAGWTLLSSAKSQSSTLIFVGKNKTITAEISEASVLKSGSKIILTVAPMNK